MPEAIDQVNDTELATDDIAQRLEAERARLRAAAGLVNIRQQFKRPVERAFTAAERGKVTILVGGMTWKHDNMFRAVFEGCGYKYEALPVPDVPAFQTGKEFGNNGQCNPTYFTVGCLVQYLQGLEREGAQVIVEPVATWVAYLLCQARAKALHNKEVKAHHKRLPFFAYKKKIQRELAYEATILGFTVGEVMWAHFYHRVGRKLGGLAHRLVDQRELARLAEPFYHRFARGGEGHLEVGKNVYYTVHHKCHMVLALKPFGCMPSSQSDGVQSAVINKFRDMIFLPIETSGEGEVNAHSRVQMALGEAKAKAKAEFETVLKSTGKSLDDIRAFVADHRELRRPFYHVPHREGIAGTAAQFVLHVNDLMNSRTDKWKRSTAPTAVSQVA